MSEKELTFVQNKNLYNSLYIFSNVLFSDLGQINCKNCDLNDNFLFMINKLFSHNLITLNLSNNQFSDIIIFNEQENLLI